MLKSRIYIENILPLIILGRLESLKELFKEFPRFLGGSNFEYDSLGMNLIYV